MFDSHHSFLDEEREAERGRDGVEGTHVHMRRSEDNIQGRVLSLHFVLCGWNSGP